MPEFTIEQVTERLQKRESDIAYGPSGPISWAQYKSAALATADLDYGCDFQDGKCKTQRTGQGFGASTRACCAGCDYRVGYLESIEPGKTQEYLKLFDLETGFWRPTGCALPRDMRSYTCLRFACDVVKPTGEITCDPVWNAVRDLFTIAPAS